jgi:hypothetical protein
MIGRNIQNRPLKFGEKDRREFIVEDSEVSLVAINDSDGDPVFIGRAKVGTALSYPMWQIRKVSYDSAGAVSRIQWPINVDGVASSDYEFSWSASLPLVISGVSRANPAVVTVASIGSLVDGDKVVLQDVGGLTEVNFTGSNIYTVANIVGSTFELLGIDSSAFGIYSGGGTVTFGDVVNYSYA